MRTKETQALYLPAPRLNQLRILKEIDSHSGITQAELARRCSLSVAMVNNYMKELCAAGLLEYRRRSSKSVTYHLTEAGGESVDTAQRDHLGCAGPNRVVLYGCGDLAELAILALESSGSVIVAVCDDDPAKIGSDWLGRPVVDPSQTALLKPDVVIVAKSSRNGKTFSDIHHLLGTGIRIEFLGELTSIDAFGATAEPGLDPLLPHFVPNDPQDVSS
jgi:DNA-binding MarR family transcriptional regulator